MSIVRVILTLAFVGAALALAAVGAAALSGIGHRWVDVVAQFPAPAFAAAVSLTALGLFLKTRAAAAPALAAAVLAVAAWPQWFPDRPEAAHGTTVRLYSANLWARNTDVDAVRRSVAASRADVVVLLEVNEVMAGRLDHILPDHPHRVVSGRVVMRGPVRQVVASRTPLTDISFNPARSATARVETAIGPITFVPTHLTRPWPFQVQWEQIRQAQAHARIRHRVEGPVVLAGDFNSVSSARIGRLLQDQGDVRPAPGWPGTWPSFFPSPFRVTIDQVYATPELVVTRRRLGRPNGSDHSPVVTDLARAG